jgi:uncharacterized protein (TIGR02172 family)
MTDANKMNKGPLLGAGRTAEVYAWGDGQILKLYRSDMPAEWVHFEARIGQIVAEAGLHAPAIGEVVQVDDRMGIVYERIDGISMLDTLAKQPWTLLRVARQFAKVHAAMHNCERPDLPSQRESMLRAIHHAPRLNDEARERVLKVLEQLPEGSSVCHGDYHPDNILMSARGPVVIDWMTTTCGNPVADVARTTLMFRVAVLPPYMGTVKRMMTQVFKRAFYSIYLRAYLELRPFPVEQIETWMPILAAARLNEGIAQEEDPLLRLAETAYETSSSSI